MNNINLDEVQNFNRILQKKRFRLRIKNIKNLLNEEKIVDKVDAISKNLPHHSTDDSEIEGI